MTSGTSEADEAIARLDTVKWVAHIALLAMERYRLILSDKEAFAAAFPNTDFDNPKITHTVGEHGVLLSTTKNEILDDHNHDLFKAWQIIGAISEMTAVLDAYLREVAERLTGTLHKGPGMLDRIKQGTAIRPSEFSEFARLRHYYELRNISEHNLGRINQRFRDKTDEHHHVDGPYTYCPQQIAEYHDLLRAFIGFVDSRR